MFRTLLLTSALISIAAMDARAQMGTVTPYCIGAVNSTGQGAHLSWVGPPNAQFGTLETINLPPNVPAMIVYGWQPAQTPFGDGYNCIGGIAWILARRPASAQGTLTLDIWDEGDSEDLAWLTYPPNQGYVWHFQVYYRDHFGPGGTGYNASDALAVVFGF